MDIHTIIHMLFYIVFIYILFYKIYNYNNNIKIIYIELNK